MKGICKKYRYDFKFFIIILLLVFLSACNGMTPTTPIINSFTADSTKIEEGEVVTLSWVVTDASSVIINPAIGSVALSGSTSVTPSETTTYTLTATKGAESSTASVTVIVEKILTIQPGPIEGKDSYVSSLTPGFNYGSNDYLAIGQSIFSTLGVYRANFVFESYNLNSFLQFDLNTLAVLDSAPLVAVKV